MGSVLEYPIESNDFSCLSLDLETWIFDCSEVASSELKLSMVGHSRENSTGDLDLVSKFGRSWDDVTSNGMLEYEVVITSGLQVTTTS